MVIWTAPAKRDLKNIHDYIADDSTYYANRVVQDIVSKTASLKDSPELGRIVPELSEPKVRELFIYSYRLIYEIQNDHVYILAIIHGKRDFSTAYQEKRGKS